MRRAIITIAAVILTAGTICEVARAKTIHVDADAAGANNGTTWADAYKFLQDALTDANSSEKPVEIRVAQGIYTPDSNSAEPNGTGDREATFQLINGVSLMGGYAGYGEPNANARDVKAYETVLSGDLDGNDVDVNDPCDLLDEPTRAENSYHVVTGSGTDVTTLLDGFVITAGNDNRTEWSCPRPPFCLPVPAGQGGGIYCNLGDPTITGCTIRFNTGSLNGGGMYNNGSSPALSNCAFNKNFAVYGGGMYNTGSSPHLTDCRFSFNSAKKRGGGMADYSSNPFLTNCEFSHDFANEGGGIYCECGNATLRDCIFYENSASVNYGAFSGAYSSACGVSSNPIMSGCVFIANTAESGAGGAVGVHSEKAVLRNCVFQRNIAKSGGAISGSSATIVGCTITGNRTHAGNGGAISVWGGQPKIINCLIAGNYATWSGGGISCDYLSDPEIIECTIADNLAAQSGGGLYVRASYPFMVGSILYGNRAEQGNQVGLRDWNGIIWPSTCTISHTDVEGGQSDVHIFDRSTLIWGKGNIDADPCFAEAGYWNPNGTTEDANDDFWVDGEYHLKSQAGRWDANDGRWVIDEVTSPCIDAGDPMTPIGLEPFPNGGIINMGAYGGTSEASKSYFAGPPCETIVAGDINGDCKVNFLDFRVMALHWLDER